MRKVKSAGHKAFTIGRRTGAFANLLRSIIAQFDLITGDPEQVEADCNRIKNQLATPPTIDQIKYLQEILPLLISRIGAIALPVYTLIEDAALNCSQPWPFLQGMLSARDESLAKRALDTMVCLTGAGALAADFQAPCFFALPEEDTANLTTVAVVEAEELPGQV